MDAVLGLLDEEHGGGVVAVDDAEEGEVEEEALRGVSRCNDRVVVETKREGIPLAGILADDDLADAPFGDVADSLLNCFVMSAITECGSGEVGTSAATAGLDELVQTTGATRRGTGDFGRLEHEGLADARELSPRPHFATDS